MVTRKTRKKKKSINKLAIIIVGRIKGYTHVEQNLLDLQKKYNATFFCSLNKKNNSEYIKTFCSKFNISNEQINLEIVKPPEHIIHYPIGPNTNRNNYYSQLYHLNKAFNLLEKYQNHHHVKYDCILFYRADIDAKEELNIVVPKKNTVYIPEGNDSWGIRGEMAYGNFHVMKIYCEIINSIDKILKPLKIDKNVFIATKKDAKLYTYLVNGGKIFHPEINLKRYLEINHICVKRFPYKYELHGSRHAPLPEYDDFE